MIRFLLVLLTIPVWGQALEMAVGGGVSRLSNAGLGKVDPLSLQQDDYSLKGGYRIVMRMTFNSRQFAGHETGYAYNRTQLVQHNLGSTAETGMAIHQGFYNYLLYPTREGSRIRPFGTGGVHFANFVPPGSSATSGGGSTKFGVNYGGGLKIRVSERFQLRFDVRQYRTPKPFDLINPGGWIRQMEYSTSLAFIL
jgi:opacity protein-like surface antigen